MRRILQVIGEHGRKAVRLGRCSFVDKAIRTGIAGVPFQKRQKMIIILNRTKTQKKTAMV